VPELSLELLAKHSVETRAGQGVRETAKEIGISAATLSRVERGNLPDLDTFRRICIWLNVDPGKVLGFQPAAATGPEIGVHFRKGSTVKKETAAALAEMILLAQATMIKQEEV